MKQMRNKVQLIGHVREEPELSDHEGGKRKAVFTICTKETFHSPEGEQTTETQMHKVVTWGQVARVAGQLLAKGTEVVIEGKLVNTHYADSKGIIRHDTEVQAMELLVLRHRKP